VSSAGKADENVQQVVPFLRVTNMERSVPYHVDGLGFTIRHRWVKDGKLEWCWMARGGAAMMLQEFRAAGHESRKAGGGVSLVFICEDAVAIYREVMSRGVEASEPEVGNAMWVTSLLAG